ncbi:hypothetical protein PLIIFM63780_001912 [Purpureocillium lilacinum]|nr:hypothetical protein PLIIFM63780_001912 [Purpureocillium lilacinum]
MHHAWGPKPAKFGAVATPRACDEQGPPCANCTIRNIRCTYPPPSTSTSKYHEPPPSRAWSVAAAYSSSSSASPVRRPPITPSPLSVSAVETSNRLLELELMHRWSVRTWRGLYNLPACQPFLQEGLPREGLRLPFILNGILALAALDIGLLAGLHGDRRTARYYKRAALEYYTTASAEFRGALASNSITRDTLYLFSTFGSMAGFFNFAMGDDEDDEDGAGKGDSSGKTSVVDRVHASFAMFLGCLHTAAINWDWFFDSPTSARTAVLDYFPRQEYMDLVDADTQTAIQRITSASHSIRLPPTGDPSLDSPDGHQGPLAHDVSSYHIAAEQTKYCFAERVVGRIRGFMVNLPSRCVAGPDFVEGLRTHEPMAMFILLYWGVLLHGCAADPWMWWAGTTGREVVEETAAILAGSHVCELEDVREGIAWAREQVGLVEALAEC